MKPINDKPPSPTGAAEPRTTAEMIAMAYMAYRAELRRFLAKRARSVQECDDLVQEVYLQLLRFPPREPLRETQAYLYRVAWHVVNRANEKARRNDTPYTPDALERLAEQSGFVAAEDVQRQFALQQQLIRLLGELPPICREVVLRFKCDGQNYKEIAAELGISVHMVEKHIARAVHHIRMAHWDF